MSESISAEQIRAAVIGNDLHKVGHHHCSICGYLTAFVFSADKSDVAFDPGCDCVTRMAPPEPCSYDDIAELLNRQTPETRQAMWDRLTAGGTLIP